MKNLSFILLFFLLLFSCTDKEDSDLLELNDSSIEIDSKEFEKNIEVKSSSSWSVTDIPDWCTVSDLSGNTSMTITLIIKPNETYIDRDAKLKFSNGYNTQILTIKQSGIKNTNTSELWHSFPFNSFKSVNDIGQGEKIAYSFESDEYFINQWISDKIYLGNIINSYSETNKLITEYKEFQYNPITISSMVGGKFYSDIIDTPTKQKISEFADNIIRGLPNQNNFFVITSPLEFYSYKQLFLLGYGNTGEDFCKLITGKNFKQTKMAKGVGLIYTYYQKVFDVTMDIPEKLIKEDITESFINQNNLSYVSSINYGRTAFLIVESDYDKKLVNKIIQKFINEEQLTGYENNILNSLDISYLYYTKDSKLIVKNNDNKTNINEYINSSKENDIIHLNFTLNKFKDQSINTYNYKIEMP